MEIYLIIALAWLWVFGGLFACEEYHHFYPNESAIWKAVVILLFWPILIPVAMAFGFFVDAWQKSRS